MKKTLISIVAVTFIALMIANVYARAPARTTMVPVPPLPCGCYCAGLTPGFWKHNIQVYLELTNGAYSALPDGTKLTNELMDQYLADIHAYPGGPQFTFAEALAYLKLQGWSTDRTNTANWFNWAAGYGPFED